jgi:hypothetical protein
MIRRLLWLASLAAAGCGPETPTSADGQPEARADAVARGPFAVTQEEVLRNAEGPGLAMTPPQRMRGLWRDQFEGSAFYAGLEAPPEAEGAKTWLDIDENKLPKALRRKNDWWPRWVEIEFIGRKTLRRGAYGHFGMFEHYVVVDKVISARLLRPDQTSAHSRPPGRSSPE